MMLLINNSMDWFFAIYSKVLFAGVLLCWAAAAMITAVVLSMNRSVIGQLTGFVVSMTGAVWILTYLDLGTFNGMEKQAKEVIKNLVIMTLGGVSSALLVSAMLKDPNQEDDLRQRKFIRRYVMASIGYLFWFGLFASLIMVIVSVGLAFVAEPVTTKGQFMGFISSILLSGLGIAATKVGMTWIRWEGLSLLTLSGILLLLMAIFFQSISGIWNFSSSTVISVFVALLVCQIITSFRRSGSNCGKELD